MTTDHIHVPIRLFVPRSVVEFLKEEAKRRSAIADAGGNEQHWTYKQLAWVRCSIMLEEWANEQKSRLALEKQLQKSAASEPEYRKCLDCTGTGYISGDGFSEDTEDCAACGGSGRVLEPAY